jgi:XTP/dITP diphosphohydrolase
VAARVDAAEARRIPTRVVLLASSNQGKLREYRELAAGSGLVLELFPNFCDLPGFEESAPTFAENSVGKALHYSQSTAEIVLADDSGLVIPALGGAPGVLSARYGGPSATDADRMRKVLGEMAGVTKERGARFVCVISLAQKGRALSITSDFVKGTLTLEPRGKEGFGYDPIFFSPELGCTFAEASQAKKNRCSHRGRAFRKTLELLAPRNPVTLS